MVVFFDTRHRDLIENNSFSVFRILVFDFSNDVFGRRSVFVDGDDHLHFSLFATGALVEII